MAGQKKKARADQEIHPWDKQESETATAFRAFQVYLNLGPERTLKTAYAARQRKSNQKATGSSAVPGSWTGWSRSNAWPDRAAAWDAYAAKQVRDGFADALRDEVGAKSGRQTIEDYRKHLEELKDIGSAILENLRDRLKEAKGLSYLGLKDDATTAKYVAELLGRANRDLLLILGGPSLEPEKDDDDSEPGSNRERPKPVSLRPTTPPETES